MRAVHEHRRHLERRARSTSLQAQGLRNGGARRNVIEHLGEQPCCRSAQEIFDGIRAGGGRVGIASVYRVLDQLVELRLVQRVELGDGVARFEPSHGDGDHHHHLVCDDCGKVEPFSDPASSRRSSARRAGSTTGCARTRSCCTAAAATAARPPEPLALGSRRPPAAVPAPRGAPRAPVPASRPHLAPQDVEADRAEHDEDHRRPEDLDREDPDDQQHRDHERAPGDLPAAACAGRARREPPSARSPGPTSQAPMRRGRRPMRTTQPAAASDSVRICHASLAAGRTVR